MSSSPIGIYAEQTARLQRIHDSMRARGASEAAIARLPALPAKANPAPRVKTAPPPKRPSSTKSQPPVKPAPTIPTGWGCTRLIADANRQQITRIAETCAKHWEIPPGMIVDPNRLRAYVRPRQACYKLIRELLGISDRSIGWAIGHRDHSTIISGCRKVDEVYETDADFRRSYDAAHAELTAETKDAAP